MASGERIMGELVKMVIYGFFSSCFFQEELLISRYWRGVPVADLHSRKILSPSQEELPPEEGFYEIHEGKLRPFGWTLPSWEIEKMGVRQNCPILPYEGKFAANSAARKEVEKAEEVYRCLRKEISTEYFRQVREIAEEIKGKIQKGDVLFGYGTRVLYSVAGKLLPSYPGHLLRLEVNGAGDGSASLSFVEEGGEGMTIPLGKLKPMEPPPQPPSSSPCDPVPPGEKWDNPAFWDKEDGMTSY